MYESSYNILSNKTQRKGGLFLMAEGLFGGFGENGTELLFFFLLLVVIFCNWCY